MNAFMAAIAAGEAAKPALKLSVGVSDAVAQAVRSAASKNPMAVTLGVAVVGGIAAYRAFHIARPILAPMAQAAWARVTAIAFRAPADPFNQVGRAVAVAAMD